jgi:hypothetical protein
LRRTYLAVHNRRRGGAPEELPEAVEG